VLDLLHEPRFVDLAPAQVYAGLLDDERYVCSERTMYRILEANQEVRERRDQRRHPNYAAPQLLATAPNQLWSWDITKLLGPAKWTYFYLYVILDVFSRYVVGWMVAHRESASLAEKLIRDTCARQGIVAGQLTIHADRGSSMTSKPVALLLADLGVIKSHSRPYVSDDNPFSESQFKTMKYRPQFPDRFGSMVDARAFCQAFFPWYNTEHRHSGIGLLTPSDVHHGLADQRIATRARVLACAYAAHPERFVGGLPQPPARPTEVWINPPKPVPTDRGEQTDLAGSPQRHDLDSGEDMTTSNNSVCAASITLSPLPALH
jgi:putative transposase